MKHKSTSYNLIAIILLLSHIHINPAFSGELSLKPSVTSSLSVINRTFSDDTSQILRTLTLSPSLSTVYTGKDATLSMLLTQTSITRNGDNGSSDNNYTDIRLASQFELIDNMLRLDLSASQSYRAREQAQLGFSNRISSPENLTKIKTDKALLSFTLPTSPYIGLNWQASVAHTKTDRAVDDAAVGNGNRVEGSNLALAANIFNGRKQKIITYNLAVQYDDTRRLNFQNFKSTNINGDVGVRLGNGISVFAQGKVDDYEPKLSGFNISRRNLDSESHGAGFRWEPAENKRIALSYNQLKQNENTSKFMGVSTQWAFSSRTSVDLDYGKRFYGDAYKFNFNYNAKSLRASISYNEDVTTFGRLGTTVSDVGIFVCTFGSSDLEDCFQPDSLQYVLQPGEEFRSLAEISSDITENIIFRKTGNLSIGYQKRKLKASLNVRHATTEYIESDREATRISASLNLAYALGRRNDISLVTSIAEQTSRDDSNNTRTFLSTLSFSRRFEQNLNASLSLRYAKRDRSDNSLDLIDFSQELKDSSLNASLEYQF
jgi:uncharacterized protein (PEP-CTERM system associated)